MYYGKCIMTKNVKNKNISRSNSIWKLGDKNWKIICKIMFQMKEIYAPINEKKYRNWYVLEMESLE